MAQNTPTRVTPTNNRPTATVLTNARGVVLTNSRNVVNTDASVSQININCTNEVNAFYNSLSPSMRNLPIVQDAYNKELNNCNSTNGGTTLEITWCSIAKTLQSQANNGNYGGLSKQEFGNLIGCANYRCNGGTGACNSPATPIVNPVVSPNVVVTTNGAIVSNPTVITPSMVNPAVVPTNQGFIVNPNGGCPAGTIPHAGGCIDINSPYNPAPQNNPTLSSIVNNTMPTNGSKVVGGVIVAAIVIGIVWLIVR